MDIKLIVAGGREFNDYSLLKKTIRGLLFEDEFFKIVVVSGGARGADQLGERFAREYCLEIDRYVPNWEPNGVFDRSAGFKRNAVMADNATHLLAFWDGESRGTKSMINIARRKGLSVKVVNY